MLQVPPGRFWVMMGGSEEVPLGDDIHEYFQREVIPQVPDAWIDLDKTKIGYETPFNRHFYVFNPPRGTRRDRRLRIRPRERQGASRRFFIATWSRRAVMIIDRTVATKVSRMESANNKHRRLAPYRSLERRIALIPPFCTSIFRSIIY